MRDTWDSVEAQLDGQPGTEAPRHRGTEAPRHRGTEAPRHRGTEAPRHRGTEEDDIGLKGLGEVDRVSVGILDVGYALPPGHVVRRAEDPAAQGLDVLEQAFHAFDP
jgi:hypothetical protein